MSDLPIVMTAAGLQPQTPASLRAQLLAIATALSPGLTANLPGSLIEDISSTDVGALTVCDSALVDLINSITPYGANEFLLTQLGNVYGVPQGQSSNTSVYVVFTGAPGFVIAKGFIVSDGTYQYTVQDGGIIGADGNTSPLFCLAIQPGIWPVLIGAVTTLITSIPSSIGVITVTNPNPGTPGSDPETPAQYRARIIEAGLSTVQGMPTTLKKSLKNISGVQARLVSILQNSGGGWKIICGGGDPYQVAYEIYAALFDVSTLIGSTTPARNISITINDYPDTYGVIFVNPPQQIVSIALTWNTTAPNFISDAAVAALGAPGLVDYVNSITVGQPMNLFELQDAFKNSVSSVIPPSLMTRMVFSVDIDSILVNPATGTGIIAGDPESYFFTQLTSIAITRG